MTSRTIRDTDAAHWGIEQLPAEHKKLSGTQIAILWGDLGIGLLVIVSGALLVAPAPSGFGLGLGPALASIVVGSIIGCFLLAYAGRIGAEEGRPSMALLRDLLGIKGSWVPTIFNVAQLVGWTAFELWAMAKVADSLAMSLWGRSSYPAWLAFFTLVVLALSLWGPVGVVKAWMSKFGAWVIIIVGVFATIATILFAMRGPSIAWTGGGVSWLGVPMDIVIALPVSWIPLVADYNRFAVSPRASAWGTGIGYLIANVWFYALGALIVAALPATIPGPEGIAASLLVMGGGTLAGMVLLTGLLVGETDEGFADVYSAAVSMRNIFPAVSGKTFVVAVTIVGAVLAGVFTMQTYEFFILLLGSVFVPLVGIWLTDRALLRHLATSRAAGRTLVAWIAGFLVYHWIAPTPLEWWTDLTAKVTQPLWPRIPWLGASIPALVVAGGLHVLLQSTRKRTSADQTAE